MAYIDQFDEVLAHVKIKEKVYVLDGTDKMTPSSLIPADIIFTEGLVIEKMETNEWGWQMLWDNTQVEKNIVVLMGSISESGEMSGDVFITSQDYARLKRSTSLKLGKEKFIEKYFTDKNPGAIVDSVEIQNESNDSLPLVQKAKFTIPLNSSGDYKYFSANLFSGLEKNPFVADARVSDVFFGTNQYYQVVANITIPEGYEFEALPKSVRMILPDTTMSFTRRIVTQNNLLSVRTVLEVNKPFFSADEYPDFKEFQKKLFDMMNEQFVIRKKPKSLVNPNK